MIDARGFGCPIPVVMTQKEVKKNAPARLEVLVDNRAAVENVSRFLRNSGYAVTESPEGEDFKLTAVK